MDYRPLWKVMESEDPLDKLVCELIKSLATHPKWERCTSSLVYEKHLGFAGLKSIVKPDLRDDLNEKLS